MKTKEQAENNKILALNPNISIFILNINDLNTTIKDSNCQIQ